MPDFKDLASFFVNSRCLRPRAKAERLAGKLREAHRWLSACSRVRRAGAAVCLASGGAAACSWWWCCSLLIGSDAACSWWWCCRLLLILWIGIPSPMGKFPESESQGILVGIILVGRVGVCSMSDKIHSARAAPQGPLPRDAPEGEDGGPSPN